MNGPVQVAVTVSQVIGLCNGFFAELQDLLIEGEVANYSVSKGKYVFFDLKDEQEDARLGCFMMAFQQNVPLEDGMRIQVSARLGVYAKSGQLRLTVKTIIPQGEGSLKRAFELLTKKLEGEGLFADSRKRSLPRYPRTVGIISSEGAAGYGDFMRIAGTRLKGIRYLFANVSVQGVNAEREIAQAFDRLNEMDGVDVVVLIRGGGSMEDLHAFNSETVARAIARSRAPVVTGIGHERDVTIADFCADVRAATPSNAAQIVIPDSDAVRNDVLRLVHLGSRLMERVVLSYRQRTIETVTRIDDRVRNTVRDTATTVSTLVRTIDVLSPIRTMERGFSVTRTVNGTPVKKVSDAPPGTKLVTRLIDGSIHSTAT